MQKFIKMIMCFFGFHDFEKFEYSYFNTNNCSTILMVYSKCKRCGEELNHGI